jgi:hypothetical protein
MRIGDVLFIGPYQYRVKAIDGKFILFSWQEKGGQREAWVNVSKVPQVMHLKGAA